MNIRITYSLIFLSCFAANGFSQKKLTYDNLRDSFLRYEFSDTTKTRGFLKQLYPIALKDKTYDLLTDYYILEGWFAEDHADFNLAMKYFNKSAEIAKKHKLKIREATAYGNLGNLYDDLSEPDKCMRFHQLSLSMCEEILRAGTKDSNEWKRAMSGKSAAMGNLASLYKEAKNYRKALALCFEGMKIDSAMKNYEFLSTGYAAIANIYRRMGKSDSAMMMLRKSVQVKYKTERGKNYINLDGLYQSYHSIGNLFFDWKNYDSAQFYYNKSNEISIKAGDSYHQIFVFNSLGDIELAKKNAAKAVALYLKGYQLAVELNSDERIYYSSQNLADAYEMAGDLRNAIKYLRINGSYKDSITNYEKIRSLGKAEVQYQFKHQSSIDSLNYVKKMQAKDELQAAENAQHEAEASRKNFMLFGVIGILVVVSVFSVYLVRLYRANKKATAIITEQKKITDGHLLIIEEKQKEIVDSINYAKRIQFALLAHEEVMRNNLPDHFVLFKPKDIVSGDFYWYTKYKNEKSEFSFLAVCDSTGHGVPGAFMSLLNISFINEAITEKNILEPNEVFNHVRNRLVQNLGIEGQKDGFDGILLRLDHKRKNMKYAAANNSPVLVNENETKTLPCDKMPVGKGELAVSFTNFEIPDDFKGMIYLPTDGYSDQFGGEKGKKLKFASMLKIFNEIIQKSMQEQSMILNNRFENWRGNLEQVDDVCIIGIRI